jgi:hypothetical protein
VPYLLNPAGIVVLVTASAEAASVPVVAVVDAAAPSPNDPVTAGLA